MNIGSKLKALVLKKKASTATDDEMPMPTRDAAAPKPVPNPWLDGRRAWNSHVGAVVSVNHVLVALALIAMFIVCGAVGGLIHVAGMSKFIPYIVEMDKMGEQIGGRVADRAQPADPRAIHAAVASFITHARMVTPDTELQRQAVFTVYSMLAPDDPATKKMNEYLNGTDDASPFKRAEKEMVSTEIKSAIPQTADTWQVDWEETVRDRTGVQVKPPYMMRALVTVYQAAPTPDTTEQQMHENAFNIHVRDYSWAKQE
jgi:type IV secretory pathway TrbF-like protein